MKKQSIVKICNEYQSTKDLIKLSFQAKLNERINGWNIVNVSSKNLKAQHSILSLNQIWGVKTLVSGCETDVYDSNLKITQTDLSPNPSEINSKKSTRKRMKTQKSQRIFSRSRVSPSIWMGFNMNIGKYAYFGKMNTR